MLHSRLLLSIILVALKMKNVVVQWRTYLKCKTRTGLLNEVCPRESLPVKLLVLGGGGGWRWMTEAVRNVLPSVALEETTSVVPEAPGVQTNYSLNFAVIFHISKKDGWRTVNNKLKIIYRHYTDFSPITQLP